MATLLELIIILVLILINGLFAMAEIAVLSARRAILINRAEGDDRGAQAALDLLEDPNRFLSTIQVGITLVGIFAGAFSSATLSEVIAAAIETALPSLAPFAEAIGVGVVVIALTYLTLVLGELVPKRIGLSNAAGIASAIAPPMNLLSRITAPVIKLLSVSTESVVRLLGIKTDGEPEVTEEEIRILFDEGRRAGTFAAAEQTIVERVLRLDDMRVSQFMTPRLDIAWLDVGISDRENAVRIADSVHSTFPVCEGSLDQTVGFVSISRLWKQTIDNQPFNLTENMIEPLYLPGNAFALNVLDQFKQAGTNMAVVIDEFGSVEGVVTLDDMLEAIVGFIPEQQEAPEPTALRRPDGTWLVDARLPVSRLKELFDLDALPDEEEARYETVAGMVMSILGRIPSETEAFEVAGLRIEVVDMDVHRIDKVLITVVGDIEG